MGRYGLHIKSLNRILSSLLILLILPAALGCRAHGPDPDLKVLAVFSDFQFVGSTPYDYDKSSKPILLQSTEPKSFPKRLESGTAYIFRHRSPVDDEKLALSELPSRLHNAGLKVVQAPTSSRDLITSYIGGPFFLIKFTDGQHTGLITNRLSQDYQIQVNSGWTGEDYILLYIK